MHLSIWRLSIPHSSVGMVIKQIKKGKRKVQRVPQSQTAALPRRKEEEKTDKSKQAQIDQTYERHFDTAKEIHSFLFVMPYYVLSITIMCYYQSRASCLLNGACFSFECGASCLGASFMWSELSWGESSCTAEELCQCFISFTCKARHN